MKKILMLMCAAFVLSGCEKETVHTIDWYKENTTERAAVIEKCKNNPAKLASSPNCINATSALNHDTLDKRGYKKRAPMNFSEGN